MEIDIRMVSAPISVEGEQPVNLTMINGMSESKMEPGWVSAVFPIVSS